MGCRCCNKPWKLVRTCDELFASHRKSLFSPRCSVAKASSNIEREFWINATASNRSGNGWNDKRLTLKSKGARGSLFSIGKQFIGVVILVEIGEEVAVDEPDAALVTVECKRDGLIDVLHLIIVRVGSAVGCQKPVEAEGAIVRLVAKVTAVCPKLVLLQRQIGRWSQRTSVDGLCNALIHPVPDGCSADAGVVVDDIPILLEVAHRIAHGMSIFTHHEGAVSHPLGTFSQYGGGEVTVIVNGRLTAVRVAERGTCRIPCHHCIVHCLEIRSHTPFVAQTPEDDARVVFVAFHQ